MTLRSSAFLVVLGLSVRAAVADLATSPDPKRGSHVIVKAGTKVFANVWDDDSGIGAIARTRSWRVTNVDGKRVRLERRAAGMIERVIVDTGSLGGSADASNEPDFIAATVEDCRDRGRCNFALKAGKRFNAVMADWSPIEAKARIAFLRPVSVCKLGPIYELTVDRGDTGWLAPGSTAWEPTFGRLYELAETIETLAGTTRVDPPACPTRKFNPMKVVIGGQGNAKPQMGMFALSAKDAEVVSGKLSNLKEAYELAIERANKMWAGDRNFCEDAVRQSVGFLGVGGALSRDAKRRYRGLTLASAKRRYWNQIILRHAWMTREYDAVACEGDLQNLVEAIQHAVKTGDTLLNFGF